MKNKFLFLLVILISFVPFAIVFPYMFNAWRTSPLDRWDWIFAGLFVLNCIVFRKTVFMKRVPDTFRSLSGWLLILAALMIFCTGIVKSIYALQIIGAIFFSYGVLWEFLGSGTAWLLFPNYGILLLSTTSTRYWLSYFFRDLQVDGLTLKLFAAASLLAIQLLLIYKWNRAPKLKTILFSGIAFLVFCSYFTPVFEHQRAPAHLLSFEVLQFGKYLGREQTVTNADRRFWGRNKIAKYSFFSKSDAVHILNVSNISNVHQIHPASHCLSVVNWEIVSEKIRRITVSREKSIYVNEIFAKKQGVGIVMWVWYSNQESSTGNFFTFRNHWNRNTNWQSYQLSTSAGDGLETGRERLLRFIQALP